ncbi:disease resistance-like protein DSC1 isoform X2 [Euphorbia lathyris]|uniref:disease resistance-like protein DSC1 isoform X2 n=1 Tax=Euphorbia lathyris TaxID=212925 RepID=UPI0033132C7A
MNYSRMKIGDIYPSGSQDLGLFGIDSRVEEVESLLCIKSVNEVRMIGIWGVGGIGKTTLANEVSHKIMNNFDGHCFISNVRERLSKKQGLKDLRSKILHEILGYKDIKIYSPCSDDFIRRKLKYMKVLLVLDDVLTYVQLKSILKECGLYSPESFGSGSRIIVTYRDWRMLENVKMKNDIYEVLPLKDNEALQVFNWHAFGRNNPQGEIVQLSKKAVKYAHGVPLALVVLGSELKSKPKRYQENALSKFKTSTRLEIHKMLRICFDGLRGDEVKIFLDIACFLKGEERDCVENFLEASGFHASNGINRLIEKYLITEEEGRISMHDLLQQMGQEIVFEEKQRQRHQSRLWTYKDVREAFTNIRGTENVEAISLRLDENVFTINISPESFIDMNKLRFLQIHHKVHCPLDLGYLPNTIRYLDWRYYPLSHLPCNFNPQMLVELHLHESQLQQLVWNQSLENLRRIDLRGSGSLIKISNLDMAYNLEVILLIDCKSLVEIGFSIKNLKLAELYLHGPQFEELIWNKGVA